MSLFAAPCPERTSALFSSAKRSKRATDYRPWARAHGRISRRAWRLLGAGSLPRRGTRRASRAPSAVGVGALRSLAPPARRAASPGSRYLSCDRLEIDVRESSRDPHSDPGAACPRRPRLSRGAPPVHGGADPRRPLYGAPKRRSFAMERRCGGHGRRNRAALTGARHAVNLDRVLASVLFTDIVGSTEHVSSSATVAGETCSDCTAAGCGPSSSAFAAARSILRATGSSPPSTDRLGRFAAPAPL